MNLGTKFALAFAAVAAAVAAGVGMFSYHVTSGNMYAEVDRSLATEATALAGGGTILRLPDPYPRDHNDSRPGQTDLLTAQTITPDGTARLVSGPPGLPVNGAERALAASPAAGLRCYRDILLGGAEYRLLTVSLGGGRGAVQVARGLGESERVLSTLAVQIALAGVVVLVIAAGIGWLVARRITGQLGRLAATAERVAATERLDTEVPTGKDEVGRLGASLHAMLGRLARSQDEQQRLVQDAAHELRTPLTSLRTNVRVLRRFTELPPADRTNLLDDLDGETRELTDLVNELVELATRQRDTEQPEPVALADVAHRAAARARRRWNREIVVDADATMVRGRVHGLDRAMSNLLENAAKFDPTGTEPIEIHIREGRVEVRDRGPGIAEQDAGHVFERFYRATSARALPGSGLGLAIVREIASSHSGEVFAGPRPEGGAVVGFTVGTEALLPNSKPVHVQD